jgi:hypothetical protein
MYKMTPSLAGPRIRSNNWADLARLEVRRRLVEDDESATLKKGADDLHELRAQDQPTKPGAVFVSLLRNRFWTTQSEGASEDCW